MTDARHLVLDDLMVEEAPYSHAVADGPYVFLAGQLAQDDPAWRGRSGTIEEETAAALDLLGRVLARMGLGFEDIVRVGVFMTDLSEFARMNAVYARYFPPGRRPARTCVGVAALLGGGRVEIDCVARRRD
jgi:2-iminobutanoate/2-iminopropanoate deaminase